MELLSTQTRIENWLKGPFDSKTKEEIQRLQKHDPQKLNDAFFKDLSFGTGGMRGIMGVGTNRMNIYTIRMATQGLANYLLQLTGPKRVFIGYDVRHNSLLFAQECAKVFAGNGFEALVSKDICPTPLVSFACRYYECCAAVMITASHNPPEYNGYKVYSSDGCQVTAPHDSGIMDEVKKIQSLNDVKMKDCFKLIDSILDHAYLEKLKTLQLYKELGTNDLKIIYSNLHGTGIRLMLKALNSWGYKNVHLVEKQATLDGSFTFAASPNPEEDKALKLGSEMMLKDKADIFIATDPDADRVGVVVNDHNRAIKLTGNQIACLCLQHICTSLLEKQQFPENAAFIKTIVTTELFKKIAEHYSAKCVDVLTGFKYIGSQIALWENSFDGYQYIFGAEESLGYLFGTFVRDKDAISSSCLIAEVAAKAKKQNINLIDQLHMLYKQFGIHREAVANLKFSDSEEGMQQMNKLMMNLRNHPPQSILNIKVIKIDDFLPGDFLPSSDVLRFWLEDGTKLVIRPSGTEPKVKIYAEVIKPFEKNLTEEIQKLDEKLERLLVEFNHF